jgi:hypothetical protein
MFHHLRASARAALTYAVLGPREEGRTRPATSRPEISPLKLSLSRVDPS